VFKIFKWFFLVTIFLLFNLAFFQFLFFTLEVFFSLAALFVYSITFFNFTLYKKLGVGKKKYVQTNGKSLRKMLKN
jgi:hypothetical protein